MSVVTRKLIAKELYLNRWMSLGAAVGTALSAGIAPLSETAFNVGALTWLTVIIAFGVMLAVYGVMNERKEQSLQFVLSLPVSIRDYVLAKVCGLMLSFLLPWLVASAAAIIMVLGASGVPDGMLPFAVALCGFVLANFSVVLCGVMHARSEALTTAVIILTNMAVSVFMFTVGALPEIKNHLSGPTPVWNDTILAVLAVELVVFLIAVTLPLATAARRRDFI